MRDGFYRVRRGLQTVQLFKLLVSVRHVLNLRAPSAIDTNWHVISIPAERIGTLEVNPATDLEQMRSLIQNMIKESQTHSNLVDWWFVDCKWTLCLC